MSNQSRRRTRLRGAALLIAAATGATAFAAPMAALADDVNESPIVVPELQNWTGGTGDLRINADSRIVADAESADVAAQLVTDLNAITGLTLEVKTSGARAGDIVLDVQSGLKHADGGERFDEEGYVLSIEDTIEISAPTSTGVFYGTRSALQILASADDRASLPRGETIDWPDYQDRGFMLDVGRRFFDADYIRDYISMMSWYKLNVFQIHLNDNEIFPHERDLTWAEAYAGFRLKSDNPEYADLASEDGAYDRADWQSFEDTASAHHMQILPEIDVPAHSLALIHWKPELGMNNGDSDHLDLTKPETTEIIKGVFDEFIPWFEGDEVHYGADEYPRQYATEYVQFFNDMAEHVRSHGKQPRAWGSATIMTGNADGYDRDVIMSNWNDGWYGMKSALDDGYRFINMNDGTLYVVPFADYYHGNGLNNAGIYANWLPNRLWDQDTVPAGAPDGAMFAVWNDLVAADYSQLDVHGLIRDSFPVIAQKTWKADTPAIGYSEFTTAVSSIGRGPSLTVIEQTGSAANGEVSFGAAVTASSTDEGSDTAALTDGRSLTKWETSEKNASFRIDLGEARSAGSLDVKWAGTAPESFRVATSTDGIFWQDANIAKDGSIGLNGVDARYVWVHDIVSGGDKIAAWSAQVFAPEAWTAGATATSSGDEAAQFPASAAVDGNPSTRWSASYVNPAWLAVDLGEKRPFSKVDILWEAAAAKDYTIQVSDDGSEWTTVATKSDMPAASGTTRADAITFDEVQARHVRVHVTTKNVDPYLSIFELSVPRPAGAEAAIVASTEAAPLESGVYAGEVPVTVSAAGSAGDPGAIEYRIEGGDWASADGSFMVGGEGDRAVQYRSTVGETSVSGFASLKVDAVSPTTEIALDPADGIGNADTPVTATITAEDALTGVSSIEYRIGDGEWAAVPENGQIVFDAIGASTLEARSTDAAGNTGTVVSSDVEIRTLDAVVLVDGVETDELDFDQPFTIAVTGAEAGSEVLVELHSDPIVLASAAAGEDGTVSLDAIIATGDVEAGAHEVVITAPDADGIEREVRLAVSVGVLDDGSDNGSGSGEAGDDGSLAVTGMETAGIVGAVLLALGLLGGGLVLARRRGATIS
ncbi:discoidin domain-containing protein [Microbacterium sp. GXF6406]